MNANRIEVNKVADGGKEVNKVSTLNRTSLPGSTIGVSQMSWCGMLVVRFMVKLVRRAVFRKAKLCDEGAPAVEDQRSVADLERLALQHHFAVDGN